MTRVIRLKPQAEIDQQAAAWIWRLDAGALGAAERSELDDWLRRDARHRRAFEEFGATWRSLDRLADVKRDEKLSALARATREVPRRAPLWWAAAAAACALAIGGGWWFSRAPGVRLQTFSTVVGQEDTVRLADGSVVALNTNTLIQVRLSATRRDIYLVRGEAHFHDTHEPARPFFVHAGDARVQAIGTQFEVRLHSDRHIDVLVNQGLVEVQSGTGRLAQLNPFERDSIPRRTEALRAGERLSIDGNAIEVEAVSSQQIAADLAWRQGALVFDNEPLSQAVAEVGRYTREHIVLESGVGNLRISGRFMTDDVPGFFKALATALPVRVTRAGPDRITVRRR